MGQIPVQGSAPPVARGNRRPAIEPPDSSRTELPPADDELMIIAGSVVLARGALPTSAPGKSGGIIAIYNGKQIGFSKTGRRRTV